MTIDQEVGDREVRFYNAVVFTSNAPYARKLLHVITDLDLSDASLQEKLQTHFRNYDFGVSGPLTEYDNLTIKFQSGEAFDRTRNIFEHGDDEQSREEVSEAYLYLADAGRTTLDKIEFLREQAHYPVIDLTTN